MTSLTSGSCRALIVFSALLLLGFTYQRAVPGRPFVFPRDHAAHKEYKTEWWYYTGHLVGPAGERFGYQLTFFRSGLRDRVEKGHPGGVENLLFAHFALTNETGRKFVFFEKTDREGERAWADEQRYAVGIDNWQVKLEGGEHHLRAGRGSFAIDLKLSPIVPPVVHGRQGVSQKSQGSGRASYYYSVTRLETMGELRFEEKTLFVRGLSWMDHEFGSNQLAQEQVGWDWFSIQLEEGSALMLFQIRKKDGSIEPESSGTLVHPGGSAEHLALNEFTIRKTGTWRSPASGAVYPMGWAIDVPGAGLRLELTAALPTQELDTGRSTRVVYWEGSVHARGELHGNRVEGLGYVEMTGYARPFDKKL